MDFLNKAFAQLTDLFRSMTPGARITTAVLLAAVVVSLGYLVNTHGTSADTYLMNGEVFNPQQIPAMEAAFGKASLNSHQWEGTKLRVPHSQQNAYMKALAEDNALPENYGDILSRALDKDNIFVDPRHRTELLKAAKQKQLELIISAFPGVSKAFVIYDSETKRGLSSQTVTTASVNVKPATGAALADSLVTAIRNLVSRSIAGLDPKNVAVTDLSSGISWSGSHDGSASALDDPYATRKKSYENQWREKIQAALSYVPGVLVTANVDLEPTLTHRREMVKPDPKAVAAQTTEESTTKSTEGSANGGRPGYQAQQPNTPMNLNQVAAKGPRDEQEEKKSTNLNVVGGERDTLESAALTPKRVSVAVGVPMSYFVKIWREKNPQAADKAPDQAALDQLRTDETAKIKTHVTPLLPTMEGVNDPAQLVQVTTFQDLTPPEIPAPKLSENATAWMAQNWSTVAIVLLSGFALLMLRSMVRSAAPVVRGEAPAPGAVKSAAASLAEKAEEAAEEAAASGAPATVRLRRFSGNGPSLRDELSQLVQEDPGAAASVLRAWIGNAMATK